MAICQSERSRTNWGKSWAWYKSQLSGQLAFKRLAASLASCQCHPCAMDECSCVASERIPLAAKMRRCQTRWIGPLRAWLATCREPVAAGVSFISGLSTPVQTANSAHYSGLLNGMPSSLPACKLILSIVSAAQVFLYCFVIVKLHLTQPCKVETLFKANIKWPSPCIVCQAFAMNQSTEYFLDYIGKLIGSDAEASRKEPPAGLSSGISSIRIWVSEDSNFDRLCQLQVNSNKNNSKFGWSFLFNKLKKPFRGVFQKVRSLWKKFKR